MRKGQNYSAASNRYINNFYSELYIMNQLEHARLYDHWTNDGSLQAWQLHLGPGKKLTKASGVI